MPAGYGVGDHRLFVVDFLTSSLVGVLPPRIVRAGARRLNTNIDHAAANYNDELQEQVLRHNIIQRFGAAHDLSTSKPIIKEKCDKIDNKVREYM